MRISQLSRTVESPTRTTNLPVSLCKATSTSTTRRIENLRGGWAASSPGSITRFFPYDFDPERKQRGSFCCTDAERQTRHRRNIASLTNVGGVNHFSSTLLHALVEERHFALIEDSGLRRGHCHGIALATKLDPLQSQSQRWE